MESPVWTGCPAQVERADVGGRSKLALGKRRSWIGPLAGDDTLVMTAADAEHTSYGCGRGSELTYFGRAVFGEQLRRTRSFEQAHAAARVVIEQREKQAGKTDGYSNPQIVVGGGARATLARLEQQFGGP